MRSLVTGLCAIFAGIALYSWLLDAVVAALALENEQVIYLLNKGTLALLLLLLVVILGHRQQVALNCRARLSTVPVFWPMLAIVLLVAAGSNPPLHTPLSLIMLFLIAVAVGLSEEILFRGYVMHWSRHYAVRLQIVISGVAFGAVHLLGIGKGLPTEVILSQAYFAAALGMIFACARIRDGSLFLAIVAHSLFDFGNFWASGGIRSTFENPAQIIPGMLIGGTVSLVWAGILIYKAPATREGKLPDSYPADSKSA